MAKRNNKTRPLPVAKRQPANNTAPSKADSRPQEEPPKRWGKLRDPNVVSPLISLLALGLSGYAIHQANQQAEEANARAKDSIQLAQEALTGPKITSLSTGIDTDVPGDDTINTNLLVTNSGRASSTVLGFDFGYGLEPDITWKRLDGSAETKTGPIVLAPGEAVAVRACGIAPPELAPDGSLQFPAHTGAVWLSDGQKVEVSLQKSPDDAVVNELFTGMEVCPTHGTNPTKTEDR